MTHNLLKYAIVSNERDESSGELKLLQFFSMREGDECRARAAAEECGHTVLEVFGPGKHAEAFAMSRVGKEVAE
ncbi:MAG: hypothetical protein ABF443_14205 [Acetobacter malorum]|uniref:hypothetical protein n=1 Tax=Acetobacter malorum TaxID=178901 RepID=UPI0039ED9300